jgi:hypothetical protein
MGLDRFLNKRTLFSIYPKVEIKNRFYGAKTEKEIYPADAPGNEKIQEIPGSEAFQPIHANPARGAPPQYA